MAVIIAILIPPTLRHQLSTQSSRASAVRWRDASAVRRMALLHVVNLLLVSVHRFLDRMTGFNFYLNFYPQGKTFLIVMRCRDDDGLRWCLLRISVGLQFLMLNPSEFRWIRHQKLEQFAPQISEADMNADHHHRDNAWQLGKACREDKIQSCPPIF